MLSAAAALARRPIALLAWDPRGLRAASRVRYGVELGRNPVAPAAVPEGAEDAGGAREQAPGDAGGVAAEEFDPREVREEPPELWEVLRPVSRAMAEGAVAEAPAEEPAVVVQLFRGCFARAVARASGDGEVWGEADAGSGVGAGAEEGAEEGAVAALVRLCRTEFAPLGCRAAEQPRRSPPAAPGEPCVAAAPDQPAKSEAESGQDAGACWLDAAEAAALDAAGAALDEPLALAVERSPATRRALSRLKWLSAVPTPRPGARPPPPQRPSVQPASTLPPCRPRPRPPSHGTNRTHISAGPVCTPSRGGQRER